MENNNSEITGTKVAGVVVLYHPDSKVEENILSYIDQVDILFAVDNSLCEYTFSDKISNNPKIEYLPQFQNKGIAAALNIGAHKAITNKYQVLLTMDQDSRAEPDMVKNLLNRMTDSVNIGIISPFHLNNYNKNELNNQLLEKEFVKTSGNILNLIAYEKTGDFREELFIDYVDIDYGFRLNKRGYKVLMDYSIPLIHKEADIIRKKILWFHLYCYNHDPIRIYYKFRNLFYLKTDYPNFFWKEFFHQSKMLIKAVIFEKNKFKKIKWAFLGILDSYRKNLGICSYTK